MEEPVVISQSPNKPNINYAVVAKPPTFEKVFMPLLEEIRTKRASLDRVIVFGQTYNDCTSLFLFIKSTLEAALSQPPGLQQFACYRIVDMFTACTTQV